MFMGLKIYRVHITDGKDLDYRYLYAYNESDAILKTRHWIKNEWAKTGWYVDVLQCLEV